MFKCMYPARSTEIPWIKRNRLKKLKTILGEDRESETDQFELTTKEFLIMTSMCQTNVGYLIHFLDLAISYGGMVVCISYVLLTAMLGMPLSMLFTFMSAYSKKSYLVFWDCAPLFQGLGYSLAMMRLIHELYNTALCGTALMIIPMLFHESTIERLRMCGYAWNDCISVNSTEDRTEQCDTDRGEYLNINKTMIATQYYVRKVAMKYSYTRTTRLMLFNHGWLMWTALIWLLLFACAVLGIKRVRKITVNLELLFAMIVICVIVIAIFHFESDHEISFMGGSGLGSLLKYDFWIEMILHSAETNVLSNLIWLGSLKPQSLSPKFAALVTSPIKLVVLISAVCFTSLFGQEALHNYKITDQNCLLMEGFDILFVFVPDVLFRTKIKALLNLFWYLSLSYFSFIAPLCTVIATTDSIIHQHQWLRPHRLYLCAALCIFGCLINIWYIQDAGNVIVKMWKKFAVPMLTSALLVMITLAICFVYSINSVINDYRFTYGVPPDNYWVVFWKASPIFSIFSFIFVLYRFKSLKVMMPQAEYIFTVQHCTCFFVLFPIFALLLSRCFKHIKYRTLRLLSIPADDWGPYLEEEKISRIYFFPHRDVKHRNPVVNCKHKCSAMNKTRYREEVLRQNEKLLELKNEFSKHIQGNDKQL